MKKGKIKLELLGLATAILTNTVGCSKLPSHMTGKEETSISQSINNNQEIEDNIIILDEFVGKEDWLNKINERIAEVASKYQEVILKIDLSNLKVDLNKIDLSKVTNLEIKGYIENLKEKISLKIMPKLKEITIDDLSLQNIDVSSLNNIFKTVANNEGIINYNYESNTEEVLENIKTYFSSLEGKLKEFNLNKVRGMSVSEEEIDSFKEILSSLKDIAAEKIEIINNDLMNGDILPEIELNDVTKGLVLTIQNLSKEIIINSSNDIDLVLNLDNLDPYTKYQIPDNSNIKIYTGSNTSLGDESKNSLSNTRAYLNDEVISNIITIQDNLSSINNISNYAYAQEFMGSYVVLLQIPEKGYNSIDIEKINQVFLELSNLDIEHKLVVIINANNKQDLDDNILDKLNLSTNNLVLENNELISSNILDTLYINIKGGNYSILKTIASKDLLIDKFRLNIFAEDNFKEQDALENILNTKINEGGSVVINGIGINSSLINSNTNYNLLNNREQYSIIENNSKKLKR